jgi:hypothetical protein
MHASRPTCSSGIAAGAPIRRSVGPGRRRAGGMSQGLPWCLLALVVAPALLAGRAAGAVAPAAVAAAGPAEAAHAAAAGMSIDLGRAIVPLNGPWRFHLGDDPRWAAPEFDDSGWETVDLTPAPGAHDDDVGLTGYVPGWMARGHAGYFGYAWYRLRVSARAARGDRLAIAGPLYVDSVYQLFLDGRLLGGIGDFSGARPLVFSRRPQRFLLPRGEGTGATEIAGVVAIRAWMGRGAATGAPDAGGIHIAPSLGEAEAVAAHNEHQWLEIFSGYLVDAVEPLAFLLLALMAWSVMPLDRAGAAAYRWLILALLLTAAVRANQPFFFWTHIETLQVFDVVRNLLLTPLVMGTWMMAWHAWFRLRRPAWLPALVVALTLLYLAAQLFTRAWMSPHLPHPVVAGSALLATGVRLAFVLVLALIAVLGLRQGGQDRWLALAAILLVAVALFAQEATFLHIKGIWFPFGVGVSRTEYALAALDLPLFALLLRRLHRCAQPAAVAVPP